MPALDELVKLTHAGITTGEFEAVCQRWLASARHPRTGRPYPEMVYQPMLELLGLLERSGFACWIFSGGGTGQILGAAAEHKWTMIDMAADWSAVHPPKPRP